MLDNVSIFFSDNILVLKRKKYLVHDFSWNPIALAFILKGSVQETSCIWRGVDQQLNLALWWVNDHKCCVNRMTATTLLSDFIGRIKAKNVFEGRQPLLLKGEFISWKGCFASKQLYEQKLFLCRGISDSGFFLMDVFVPLSWRWNG